MENVARFDRSSLPRTLQARAEQPPQLAFRFLRYGTDEDVVDWTYQDLLRHAAVVASELRARGLAEGRRVVLALDPGLPYVAALFGIFQVGATVVPSFPPTGRRMQERFVAIYQDCDPDLIIADPRYDGQGGRLDPLLAGTGGRRPEWLFVGDGFFAGRTSTNGEGSAGGAPVATDPALLQYTSGSTGRPKGVVLTHDNLVSNSLTLEHNMGFDPDRVGCSWLPPYHDMGLIGTIVLAVFSGWPLVMLSPLDFVQHPYRWLKAITDNKVTISVAPNFALDLCTGSITDDELATLDLSTLRQLYCGAEPVVKATLDEFRDRFAPAGYDENAIIPCYGMAEATLFVSGKPDGTAVKTSWLDREALEIGVVRPRPAGTSGAVEAVSCGTVAHGHEVLVVDPDTAKPLGDGSVGEIWVTGPNVTAGYFRKPEETAETYGARPAGTTDARAYLRTGDLGFLLDGELYVTGRIKDLIVVAGRNLYPQDIELSVRRATEEVRNVAAFSVTDGGAEELIVAVELRRGAAPTSADVDQVRERVVAAVTADHGVSPTDVYVGPAGTVRTTTSGKVQRTATRTAYRRGELKRLTLADDRGVPTR